MTDIGDMTGWGPYAFGVVLFITVWRVVLVPLMQTVMNANASNLAACQAAKAAAETCKEAAETCRSAALAVQNATTTAERLFGQLLEKRT